MDLVGDELIEFVLVFVSILSVGAGILMALCGVTALVSEVLGV